MEAMAGESDGGGGGGGDGECGIGRKGLSDFIYATSVWRIERIEI